MNLTKTILLVVALINVCACGPREAGEAQHPELPADLAANLVVSGDSSRELITGLPSTETREPGDAAPDIQRQKVCTTQYSAKVKYQVTHCVLTEEDLGSAIRAADTEGQPEEPLGANTRVADLYSLSAFRGQPLEQPLVCGDFGEGPWDVLVTQEQRCFDIDDEFELVFTVGGKLFRAIWFGTLADRPTEFPLTSITQIDQSCKCCTGFKRCPAPPGEPTEAFSCKLERAGVDDPCAPMGPR